MWVKGGGEEFSEVGDNCIGARGRENSVYQFWNGIE